MKFLFLYTLIPVLLFGETTIVDVKGLVCPSCAIGIKVHLSKTKKVKKVILDINKQLAIITETEGKKLTDEEIELAIKKAGYEIGEDGIKRK